MVFGAEASSCESRGLGTWPFIFNFLPRILIRSLRIDRSHSFIWTCHTASDFWAIGHTGAFAWNTLLHDLCLAAFSFSLKSVIKSHLPRVPLQYALEALYTLLPSYILSASNSLIAAFVWLILPINAHLLLYSRGSTMPGTQ